MVLRARKHLRKRVLERGKKTKTLGKLKSLEAVYVAVESEGVK
jgi:hypothetical protein